MASTYERGYSFSGFQTNQPQRPLPAQQLDIELDSIARAIAALWARGSGGGGTPGPALDLPIAGLSLKANLLSGPAIPQIVQFEQFKQALGIGSGGGSLPDWNDVQNKPTFGNAAQRNVGASAGTVAAGDDPRIVGALQAASNGSDFANKAVARSNLGLKGAALLDVGTGPGTVAAGDDPRIPQQALGAAAYLGVGAPGGVMLFNDARVAGRPIVAQMPTDGSDGTPAFVAACNQVMATSRGGTVIIPAGRHNMLTRPTVTIPEGKRLTIVGAGAAATSFLFPNPGGFIFNYGSKFSSLTLYDFEVVTDRQSGGTAIRLVQPTPDSNPADTAQNHFYNITVRGESGENPGLGYIGTNYWTIGYDCQNVSNCHWNGGLIDGATLPGGTAPYPGAPAYNPKGFGVRVTGSPSGSLYAAVFNFLGTTFNYLERGFIYGSWIQGVTMTAVNFTQCVEGVYTDSPAGSELHGLNITQSQFGCTGFNINLAGFIGGVTIDNNLIVPQPNQNGIRINSAGFTVTGNAINGLFANGSLNGSPTNDTGVSVTGGGAGVIAGNSFGSLYNCIYIAPGVSLVRIGVNARVANAAYVNSNGTNCMRVSEVALEANYN